MEKKAPHYRLTEVQATVADRTSRPFTRTALKRADFYKSMTTHADHQLWQDVYHGKTEDGVLIYIKITGFSDNRPPVIQFKAKMNWKYDEMPFMWLCRNER